MLFELIAELIDEQKLNEAGVGLWDFRQRFIRCLRPAILSFSKLLRCILKLTDQAQWMTSETSEVRMLYVASPRPSFVSERSDGRATSLFRETSGSE